MLNIVTINRFDTSGRSDVDAMSAVTYSVHDHVAKQVEKILENAVKEGMAFNDAPIEEDDDNGTTP